MMSQFYDGSTMLRPLSNIFGIPIDQINFVVCSLISIILGQIMRHVFPPRRTSANIRALIETVLGFCIVIFCYGHQVKYLLLQSTVSYVMLRILPPRLAAHLVTYWSLGYLAVVHLFRMRFDYGGYTMDISGPVMIQTQKLAMLGFNLLDGYRLNNGVKLAQKRHEMHAVRKLPNVVQYASYLMYFHGIQVGPFTFYNDYEEYLIGYGDKTLPCAKKQIRSALFMSFIFCLLTAYVAPQFPYLFVVSTEYQRMHMIRRIVFTSMSFFLVRQKYYFAWSIAEVASLSAGFGYAGKTETMENDWSRIKNYNFVDIESGSCLKNLTDGWNMSTARWLRELVYERAPLFCRTLLVYATSAFWHGFYPGYYLMFATFAIFTFCARTVRKHIRPLFMTNPITFQLYHILTKGITNLSFNYGQGPFFLLEFQAGLLFWKPYFFFGHVIAISIILIFQVRPIFNDKVGNIALHIPRKSHLKLIEPKSSFINRF